MDEYERMRCIVESDSMMIWNVDRRQCFSYVNPGWLHFIGSRGELELGRRWGENIHPEDLERCETTMNNGLQMHQGFTVEYRRRRFDGEYRWLRDTCFPLIDGAGAFSGMVGTSIGIEEFRHSIQQQQRSERRYRAVVENTAEGFLFFDPQQGQIREVNDALCQLSGLSKHQFFGKRIGMLVIPQDRQRLEQLLARLESENGVSGEFVLSHPVEGERYVQIKCTLVRDAEGRRQGGFAFIADVHRQKIAERELRLAAAVLESSSEAVMVVGRDDCILSVNPAFSEITGYQRQQALGEESRMLAADDREADLLVALWRQLDVGGRWQGEVRLRSAAGRLFPCWLSVTTIHGADREPYQYVAVFSDITERKKAEELLRRQAATDPLTGLLNRRAIQDMLAHRLGRCDRSGDRLGLLFIDLDRFKPVNDDLGHQLGDELLMQVAERLRRSVRTSDTVGRFGGDEFVVLLSDIRGPSEAAAVAAKVTRRLERPFVLDEHRVEISCSIGIALIPDHGCDADVVVERADQAMYRAKEAGGGCYIYWQPEA